MSYLDEGCVTWRYNSALKFIANTFQSIVGSTLYVDLPGFFSPSIITGNTFRPDLLLSQQIKKLFVLELTVGFETNLNINAQRKRDNYQQLLPALSSQFLLLNFQIYLLAVLGFWSFR